MSLNRQQVFDNALNQIRAQNYARSFDADRGCCMYRGPNGVKCAIGVSIPDEDYARVKDDIEEQKAEVVIRLLPELFDGSVDEDFVNELQIIHDEGPGEANKNYAHGPLNPKTFESQMRAFAKEYNLTYTPPQE